MQATDYLPKELKTGYSTFSGVTALSVGNPRQSEQGMTALSPLGTYV